MKRTTLLIVAVLALTTAACSSMKVNNDFAAEADFSSYKTYAWHDDDTSLQEENMLAHERVVQAVDGQLAAKGFSKASSNPDVYVTYHSDDQENTTLDTTSMGYGYGPGWGWGGHYGGGMGGMGSTTTQVRTYTTGTVVVDIWDASEKALVWRGIASDTVSDNPQKNSQKIQKAAEKMFENYPPK
jgi:hypothetical protein